MIMKFIGMDFLEHDKLLGNKIDSNEDYKAARKTLCETLSLLDKKIGTDIDDKAGYAEALSRDLAYDEGFSAGIKFIMGCISSGEGLKHE